MPRALVTAEAFGFGPASKLHAICIGLQQQGIECHFAGEAAALTFARANADAFTSITEVDSMTRLALIHRGDFAVAISVMDPFLPLWASMNRVPSIYVDSLYWFWHWQPGPEADLRTTADRLCASASVADALAEFRGIPLHESEYIAHYLSSVTCAQRTPKVETRANRLSGQHRVEIVDAVIDLSHRAPGEPEHWLATTSGMVNPLLPLDSAVGWVQAVTHLLDEAAQLIGSRQPILLAGNPQVLELAAEVGPERIQIMPMDHGKTLEMMNTAIACLTPPGLTTMLESAAYGAPVVLLPEQHYGHLSNYLEISRCGAPGAFPHGLVDPGSSGPKSDNIREETLALSERLLRCFKERDETWTRMVAGVAEGMGRALRDRAAMLAAQDAAVREFVGGYSGAAQVCDVVDSVIARGTP